MSRSVNKVILIGNLGKDPDLKYTSSGKAMARFSIATSDRWKDKTTGELQEKTEWHNIIAWDQSGEYVGKNLHKGDTVYIEGTLQTRSWDDPASGQKKYMTEINARDIQSLTSRSAPTAAAVAANGDVVDDDIPF